MDLLWVVVHNNLGLWWTKMTHFAKEQTSFPPWIPCHQAAHVFMLNAPTTFSVVSAICVPSPKCNSHSSPTWDT